jgi:hypothetical protein
VSKDRLLLLILLGMLAPAIAVPIFVILGAVEDCGPDGDCNLESHATRLSPTR